MSFRRAAALVIAPLALFGCKQPEEIVLKVEHFLPATSNAHQNFIQPWCERVAAESKDRIKCQIFPSMQLGGSPGQLYDQVKDGVVDVGWTIPGYTAGRFPLVEVFELPFMIRDPEPASHALWDYVQQNAAAEFADVKTLAFHVHGGGVFNMVSKPIVTNRDLQGQKVRAPTRQSTKLLAVLGATAVGMPISQVPEALSKGVIDGALVPYEVVPAIKADELTKFHSEPDPRGGAIYTTVFVFAMNRAKYDGLPADLKKVIDDNSGPVLSAQIGRVFREGDERARSKLPPESINVISLAELEKWKDISQRVRDDWVKEVTASGADGTALLERAQSLIEKYGQK